MTVMTFLACPGIVSLEYRFAVVDSTYGTRGITILSEGLDKSISFLEGRTTFYFDHSALQNRRPPVQSMERLTMMDTDTIAKRPVGQLTGLTELEEIVSDFPNIVHSFGYGSGVFQQTNTTSDTMATSITTETTTVPTTERNIAPSMVDLILVTDNQSHDFHRMNLTRHASHYATLTRLGGPSLCQHIQQDYGAGVFFHTMIPTQHSLLKYGIVTVDNLAQDLKEWTFLYLAGRLQKPTLVIRSSNPDIILDYQETYNLPYALSTALLLLSESTSETLLLTDLYEQISQLSYTGDPRMKVGGEDPDKVRKLVHSPGQLDRFQQLYKSPLLQLEQAGILSINHHHQQHPQGTLQWNPQECRRGLVERLPPRLQHCHSNTLGLSQELRQIVSSAATSQSLKGIVTTGLSKSAQYAMAKLSKGLLKHIL